MEAGCDASIADLLTPQYLACQELPEIVRMALDDWKTSTYRKINDRARSGRRDPEMDAAFKAMPVNETPIVLYRNQGADHIPLESVCYRLSGYSSACPRRHETFAQGSYDGDCGRATLYDVRLEITVPAGVGRLIPIDAISSVYQENEILINCGVVIRVDSVRDAMDTRGRQYHSVRCTMIGWDRDNRRGCRDLRPQGGSAMALIDAAMDAMMDVVRAGEATPSDPAASAKKICKIADQLWNSGFQGYDLSAVALQELYHQPLILAAAVTAILAGKVHEHDPVFAEKWTYGPWEYSCHHGEILALLWKIKNKS